MRLLSRRAFLGAGAAALPLLASGSVARADSPNVLFIMADDLGREILKSYGGRSYATPRLDKLAKKGMRFKSAFSSPVCTVTRVQLMSGLYPFRTGWTRNMKELEPGQQLVDPSIPDFAKLFKAAGYRTAVAGKWQVANVGRHPEYPFEVGFDEYCLWSTDPIPGSRTSKYWQPSISRNGEPLATGPDDFGPDIFADFLIRFMRRNRGRPFFAYFPMNLPHGRIVKTPGRKKKSFAGMVSYMDGIVGRLVSSLRSLGLRGHTLVLFTGDNGSDTSVVSQFRKREIRGGKSSLRDSGIHVPLIANWPGVIRPSVNRALVDFSDFYPTFADLVDQPLQRHCDGVSFWHLLHGETSPQRRYVFSQYQDRKIVRNRGWKLYEDGALFDLKRDRSETNAILPQADSEKSASVRAELSAALAAILAA